MNILGINFQQSMQSNNFPVLKTKNYHQTPIKLVSFRQFQFE